MSDVQPITDEALDSFEAFVRKGHDDAESLPDELVELGIEADAEISLSTGDMLAIIARLRAAEAAQQVPAGWRVVPIEPTRAMCDVGWATERGAAPMTPRDVWMAMLTAAPLPPPPEQQP